MKLWRLFLIAVCLMAFSASYGQQKKIDSLLNLLGKPQPDTVKAALYSEIGNRYIDINNTLALQYTSRAIAIRLHAKQPLELANDYLDAGYCYQQKSDYAKSLDYYLKAVNIYAQLKAHKKLLNAYVRVAGVYGVSNDHVKAKEYLDEAEKLAYQLKNDDLLGNVFSSKGVYFDRLSVYDSALVYNEKAYKLSIGKGDDYWTFSAISNIGLTYKHMHKFSKAMASFETALALVDKNKWPAIEKGVVKNNIGATYAESGNYAAARQNFDESILLAKSAGVQDVVLENYRNLADMYTKLNDYKQQASYLKKYYTLKDSLFNLDTKNQMTQLEANFRIGQKNETIAEQKEEVQKQTSQRNILLIATTGALLLLLVSVIFYGRIKKNNRLLVEKNNQINAQKNELEHTLAALKSAQAQLIQSEKLASIGQLTKGIVDRLLNPLNYINNFSVLSKDLVKELTEAVGRPEMTDDDKDDIADLLDTVNLNLQKVSEHGTSAVRIIKAMEKILRKGSTEFVDTDLNQLVIKNVALVQADLHKSYPDQSIEIVTNLDPNNGAVKALPYELDMALTNLVNNAIYAVAEKAQHIPSHKPKVEVSTLYSATTATITVRDNGKGLLAEDMKQLFSPFFTTKPTAKGTGLGLYLSREIIKQHDGTISVNTKEGEHAEFVISLPVRG